jgi:indolepyruvate ferredoxin oxidoreductase alpha subunit
MTKKMLLSGNEAVALAAIDAAVNLGCGYPGTPSSEILDEFSRLGGCAEWAPNEKTALEVGIGVAFANGRALVTMKHVGLNVAADPLFTIAYSGTPGGLVIISADDPGMASSQNEQDNRRYANAAGVPMFEPADSQECYDFTRAAFELADRFRSPVLLRLTTRVCHSKCAVVRAEKADAAKEGSFTKDTVSNVMIPAYARKAHRRLRADLESMREINESGIYTQEIRKEDALGVVTSGISFQHLLDADPKASVLKLGMTWPLPFKKVAEFAASVKRCIVLEEGDPALYEAIRSAGIEVEGRPEMYRFGELNVARVRRILAGDLSEEPAPIPGKPPQLCPGCPHRKSFEVLRDLNCIVSGDIGCYTLGVLPPFEAIDTCVCMGASVTVGVGMRKMLPEAEARRVVSVIGDSTFWHSGVNGLIEMVYNPPSTGHIVIVLDNSTTAMTGMQEHPGTGRKLDHSPAPSVSIEKVAEAIGMAHVDIVDSTKDPEKFKKLLQTRMAENVCSMIIVRRPCIIALAKSKNYAEEKK